jgi:hypothetical protein
LGLRSRAKGDVSDVEDEGGRKFDRKFGRK